MKRHRPFDRNGTPIDIGDMVRIVGIPDLFGMSHESMAESLPVFQYLVGKRKRIRGFDERGCAEFCFTQRHCDGERVRHSVGIEPKLLHVPRRKLHAGQPASRDD